MGREVTTGVVYEGVDRGATKTMKAVSKEAKNTQSKLKGMGKHVQAMPDAMGKSAAAMAMMQSEMSGMGAKVADAGNKIMALGALVAMGGPVGIAIAAATAAMAGLAFAYDTATEATRNHESALRSLKPVMDAVIARTEAQRDRLRYLKQALIDIGKTEKEMLAASVARNKAGVAGVEEMIAKDKDRVAEIEANIEAQRQQVGGDILAKIATEARVQALEDELVFANANLKASERGLAARMSNIAVGEEELKVMAAQRKNADDLSAAEGRRTKGTNRRQEAAREAAAAELAYAKLILERMKEDLAQRKAAADAKVALAEFTAGRIAAIDAELEAALDAARDLDEKLEADKEKREAAARAAKAAAISSQTMAVMASAKMEADAAEDTSSKVEAYTRALARQVIEILAVKASAAAAEYAYEQVPPPYSVVAAAAAAAVAYGSISAIAAQLNRGGVVRGSGNRDIVHAMLTPGEVVMSTSQVDSLRALISNLGAPSSTGRRVAARLGDGDPQGDGGGTTVVNQFTAQQMFPDRMVSLRAMRRQSRSVTTLQRRGMFPV